MKIKGLPKSFVHQVFQNETETEFQNSKQSMNVVLMYNDTKHFLMVK